MKRQYSIPVFLLLCIIILYKTNYAQTAWEKIILPESFTVGNCIDASDSSNAIISVGKSVYKTTDGGVNWIKLDIPVLLPFETIWDISLINDSLIWAVTDEAGRILHSPDGGVNWTVQFTDTSVTDFMNYIEMFDELNGIAMGDAYSPPRGQTAVFLRTTNGGLNWIKTADTTLVDIYSGDTWRRLDFTDIMNGYFFSSGESPQKLYKTTDGGDTWLETKFTGRFVMLKSFNEDLVVGGITTTTNVRLYRTNDGGDTWGNNLLPVTAWPTDIEFIPGDGSKLFLLDQDGLYFSSDTGKTVTEILWEGKSMPGWDMVFTDANHGWILGDSNVVYKTNKGGVISRQEELYTSLPAEYQLSQNYPNPFNPSTVIKYHIPENGYVTLKIYDILGKEITTLVNEEKSAGRYEVNFNASGLSSGVYIYQVKVNGFIASRKMVMMK